MMAGPMANALSTFSSLMSFSIPTVTTPFSPYEPSSVMMTTLSLYLRTSFSRIMRSLLLPAKTESTRLPASFSALIIGSIGATPTPPPAQSTVPNFSICVGLPNGPTTSSIKSPSFSAQSLVVESPTACTTNVMVPLLMSASAMVSGTRSPFLPTRTMTKLPAFLLFAISGASTSSKKTFSENCSFRTILFIMPCYLFTKRRAKVALFFSNECKQNKKNCQGLAPFGSLSSHYFSLPDAFQDARG